MGYFFHLPNFYIFAEYFYNAAVATSSRSTESCSTAAAAACMALQHNPFSGQQPTQLPAAPSATPLDRKNLTIPCSAQKNVMHIPLRETTKIKAAISLLAVLNTFLYFSTKKKSHHYSTDFSYYDSAQPITMSEAKPKHQHIRALET